MNTQIKTNLYDRSYVRLGVSKFINRQFSMSFVKYAFRPSNMRATLIKISDSHFVKQCTMSKLSVIITVYARCARDPDKFKI